MNHLLTEQFWDLIENKLSRMEKLKLTTHLETCAECSQILRSIELLEHDLKELTTPEVAPGFALRVTSMVRQMEAAKLFDQTPFRVFKWGLTGSAIILISILTILVPSQNFYLPRFHVPGGSYILISMICIFGIFLLDKIISQRIQTKM